LSEEYVSARNFKGFGEGRREREGGLGGGDFPDAVRFLMGGVGWLSNGHDLM